MYQLFNLPQTTKTGSFIDPYWSTVKAGLLVNLNRVIEYYRTHTFAAPIDTILVSIINALGAGPGLSDSEYYSWLQRNALSVSQSLQITSSATRGKVFKNQFYGPGIREILISESQSFDYRQALINWQTQEAVSVLSHPFSDLSIPILNTTNLSNQKGYAVLAINIPLLMMQYRGFRAFERNVDNEENQNLPINSFIHRFVLPNTCASHLDYALFNRFYRNYFDLAQTDRDSFRHPFYMTDWQDRVDEVYQSQAQYLKTRHFQFNKVLKHIPLAVHETALELSTLPDFYRTRQINWALAISRLEMLKFLLDNNHTTFGDANRGAINSIKRHIEFYRNSQAFNDMLPPDQARWVNAEFEGMLRY